MEYLSEIERLIQGSEQLLILGLLFRVAFGALNCFMGYRLLRLWTAICGFFLGAGVGAIGVRFLPVSGNSVWIIPVAAGAVTAVLAYEVYLVGAFFLGWGLTTYAVLMIVRQLTVELKVQVLMLAAGALLGVLIGILVVKYARPCIIWLTAFSGGISVAMGLCSLLKIESMAVELAWGVAFILLGAMFQYKTTHGSRNIGSRSTVND